MTTHAPDARVSESGRALDFRIHDSFASVAALWDSLERSAGVYPFQRRAWLETWFETIGKANGWELAIIELRPNLTESIKPIDSSATATPTYATGSNAPHAQRAAIFPLGVHRVRGLRRLEWLGAGVSDYASPLFSDAAIVSTDDILLTLRETAAHESCEIVDLDRIPASLADGCENPFARVPGMLPQHYSSHAMNLASLPGPTLDILSAKERYNLRRSEKLLASGHELTLSVAIDSAERARLVEEMIQQKRARYVQMAVADNFADPSVAEFYRRATADPRIAAHLSALCLDDEPISLHWGIAEKPRMYYLMPTFKLDERAKHSPGKIFLLKFIDLIRTEGYTILDFANGDEPYKDKWCDIHTVLYRARFGVSLRGRAIAARENLLDAIKRSPLKPLLLKLRARLRAALRTA